MCDFLCDCVQPDPYFEREVVSRRNQKCLDCARVIPKGDRHFYIVGRWDGAFDYIRLCQQCRQDWREISVIFYEATGRPGTECFGGLRERVEEAVELGHLHPDDELAMKWCGRPDDLPLFRPIITDSDQMTLPFAS